MLYLERILPVRGLSSTIPSSPPPARAFLQLQCPPPLRSRRSPPFPHTRQEAFREKLYSKFLELAEEPSGGRGTLSRKRSMTNAAGDLDEMMQDAAASAGRGDGPGGGPPGGSTSRASSGGGRATGVPRERRVLRFLSIGRMSAGIGQKVSEIWTRAMSFRRDKSSQRWYIYVDQTTLESEEDEQSQRVILGQDLSEMETFWAETGSLVNRGRAAAKGSKTGAGVFGGDDDQPKRRAAKTMQADAEAVQESLQKYLAEVGGGPVSEKDVLIVCDPQNDFLEKTGARFNGGADRPRRGSRLGLDSSHR